LDRDRLVNHVGALAQAGVDAVAISTAHGHTTGVGECVRFLREQFPDLTLIAGNVTSAAGVAFLADAGANAIKVGQGPGSICTTRIVAGVGIPQLTALYVAAKEARKRGIHIIADGGITKSGDIVKALTLADGVILGGLLAGCREAPGQIVEIDGKFYKQYRGMGSLEAMRRGSAARYGHEKPGAGHKVAAEGSRGFTGHGARAVAGRGAKRAGLPGRAQPGRVAVEGAVCAGDDGGDARGRAARRGGSEDDEGVTAPCAE
jgi:IMP dehydrogenase